MGLMSSWSVVQVACHRTVELLKQTPVTLAMSMNMIGDAS